MKRSAFEKADLAYLIDYYVYPEEFYKWKTIFLNLFDCCFMCVRPESKGRCFLGEWSDDYLFSDNVQQVY